MVLSFHAARAYCGLMPSLLSARTLRSHEQKFCLARQPQPVSLLQVLPSQLRDITCLLFSCVPLCSSLETCQACPLWPAPGDWQRCKGQGQQVPLWYPCHWPPSRVHPANNLLSMPIQAVLHPLCNDLTRTELENTGKYWGRVLEALLLPLENQSI